MAVEVDEIFNIVLETARYYQAKFDTIANLANTDINRMDFFTKQEVEVIKSRYKTSKVEFEGFDKILEGADRFFEVQDLRNEFITSYNGRQSAREGNVEAVSNILNATLFPELDELVNLLKDDINNEARIGITKETQDLMWAEARDRIIRESQSALDVVTNTYATRGFTIPNGIMQKSIAEILNNRLNSISESARNINIASKESRIQWKMFAMQNIAEIKNLQISNVSRFVELNLSGERVSSDYATQYVNSYRSLYDSMNSVTNAIATINKLKLDKASTLDQQENQLWNMAVSNWTSNNSTRINARVGLANSMSGQAAAAMSGINAMVAQVTS